MSQRVLRKKARTPKVASRPITAVTWGKPAKEPYPPDRERYALMRCDEKKDEGQVLAITTFPVFTWWRRQTGPKPLKTAKAPKASEALKAPKGVKSDSPKWWKPQHRTAELYSGSYSTVTHG